MDGAGQLLYITHRTALVDAIALYDRPSGLFLAEDGAYTLNVFDAHADNGYALQAETMSLRAYGLQGPALYRYAYLDNQRPRVEGFYAQRITATPDGDPASTVPLAPIDGPREQAAFHTPHSLVTGGDGLQYFVDKGLVRTIDADLHVRTLTLPGLRAGELALDLDVDAQGQVHLVAHDAQSGVYSWHLLHGAQAGERRDFTLTGHGNPHVSMAVKDGVLWLAARDDALREKWSTIYRMAWADADANGQLHVEARLGAGGQIPATTDDFLNHPAQYRLPNVRDIHFVGNALWISVAQAVLTMEVE